MADTQEPQKLALVQNRMDKSLLIPDNDVFLMKRFLKNLRHLKYIKNVIYFLRKYHLYI